MSNDPFGLKAALAAYDAEKAVKKQTTVLAALREMEEKSGLYECRHCKKTVSLQDKCEAHPTMYHATIKAAKNLPTPEEEAEDRIRRDEENERARRQAEDQRWMRQKNQEIASFMRTGRAPHCGW